MAEDFANSSRRKGHPRLHSILDDKMALPVQGVVGKSRQFRCITLPVSSEDQEGELTRCEFRPFVASVRHADYMSLRVVSIYCLTRQTLGECSTGYGDSLCACVYNVFGFVVSFDGSAKTEKHGCFGSISWILRKFPE